MEFHYIDNNSAAEHEALLRDHCRARAEIFANWPAPNYVGGYEADVFDLPFFAPIWTSVTHEGRTLAVGRMIPADGPCTMLEEVWPHAITTPLPPAPLTFELHRIGSIPGLDTQLAKLARAKIKHGMAQLILNRGRTHMAFLTPCRVAQTSLSSTTKHGHPIDVDGQQFVVVSSEIDQDGVNFLGDSILELEAQMKLAREPRSVAS